MVLNIHICVWKTVVDLSNATRNGLITLRPVVGADEPLDKAMWPVGGANELVGGATWPVGRTTESTFTFACDPELSRMFAVLRSHSSAADSSDLLPAIYKCTQNCVEKNRNF